MGGKERKLPCPRGANKVKRWTVNCYRCYQATERQERPGTWKIRKCTGSVTQGNQFPKFERRMQSWWGVHLYPLSFFISQIWTRLLDFSWVFAAPVMVIRGEVRWQPRPHLVPAVRLHCGAVYSCSSCTVCSSC